MKFLFFYKFIFLKCLLKLYRSILITFDLVLGSHMQRLRGEGGGECSLWNKRVRKFVQPKFKICRPPEFVIVLSLIPYINIYLCCTLWSNL